MLYLPARFELNSLLREAEEQAIPEEAAPFQVSLNTNSIASSMEAGQPTELIFSLRDENSQPLQGLQIGHERILHVVITSEDFQTFAHIHPEDRGPVSAHMLEAAVFLVDYTFPKQGRYVIAVDFVHEEHEGSEQFLFDVGSRGTPVLVKDFSTTKEFDGYTVSLSTDTLYSLESAELHYSIEKDGKPVTDLEPYLTVPMHVSMVSAGLETFIHTHGEIHAGIPGVEAHVVFPFPGIYEVFGEFQHQGKVIVTSFLVEVEPGSSVSAPEADHGHGSFWNIFISEVFANGDEAHEEEVVDHPRGTDQIKPLVSPAWWILLVASLLLMSLLSLVVYKFIHVKK